MSMTQADQAHQAQLLGEPIHGMEEEPAVKKGKKKRDTSSLRKAPNAPKRFKSSYICFFVAKQPMIKAELGDQAMVTSISKRSAEMWRKLSPEERALWDEVAAKDKQRYMVEKAMYSGPWQVPWKRVKKDPSAPKRPMSAFLYYSQGQRSEIKQQNPDIKNTEVSRMLGELWRNLSEEERSPHVEREKAEREKYKIAIAAWRQENEGKVEQERKAMELQSAMGGTEAPVYQEPPSFPHGTMMNYAFPTYQPPPSFQAPAPPPYPFPTNGKQPVILGPNGAPYANQSIVTGPPQQQQVARLPQPSLATFDDATALGLMNAHANFDYMGGDGVM